jgi:hypothetical protein
MSAPKYSSKIKTIKSELSRYTHRSVFIQAISYLRNKNANAAQEVTKMPWIIMLLVKFSFLEREGELNITSAEFLTLANTLYGLQSVASNINEKGSIELKLRALTVQQLWYQQNHQTDYLAIVRQSSLLRREDEFYDKEFQKIAGLTLDNFFTIALYLMTLARVDVTSNVMEVSLPTIVYHLTPDVPLVQLANFFKLLAVKFENISNFLKNDHELQDEPQSEFFQETPFKLKPIIIDGSNVFIFNSRIFVTGISLLVPTILKKQIANYKTEFGADMESYVGRIIAQSNLKHMNEEFIGQVYAKTGLRAKYKKVGIGGKAVDYAICDEHNRVVLIECKAVEPSDLVKASYDPEILRRSLEKSFINAIVQGQETKFLLSQSPDFKEKTFKLAVITHQEFNIFGGTMVGKCIDFNLEQRMIDKYGQLPIDLNDIVYIPIGDFERALGAHSIGDINFHDFIDDSLLQQMQPAGARFSMSQVVNEKITGSIPHPSELAAEIDKLTDRVISAMESSSHRWTGKVRKLILDSDKIIKFLTKGSVL